MKSAMTEYSLRTKQTLQSGRFGLVVLLAYKVELRHESHAVAVRVDSYALDKGAQLGEEETLQLPLKVETLAANCAV